MKYDDVLWGIRHRSDGQILMTSFGHPCVCPNRATAEKIMATFSDSERATLFACEYRSVQGAETDES